MKFKVLVAEPEEMFAAAVAYALEMAGMEAVLTHDSRYALDAAHREQPDLCILSAELPAISGEHLCCDFVHDETISSKTLLFLLGTDAREEFCAAMLDYGADDYLVKPFGMREFMARVMVLLRRSHQVVTTLNAHELRAGRFLLNVTERTLTIGDALPAHTLEVTHQETRLLQVLLENAGQLVPHETLLQRVGSAPEKSTAALRQIIKALRRKLGDDGSKPRHIVSLHGQGLRFDP